MSNRHINDCTPVEQDANLGPPRVGWRNLLARHVVVGGVAVCLMGSVLPATSFAAAIQGIAFVDGNENGTRDSWEAGLANKYVSLTGAGDKGVYTDANGNYSFVSLGGGSYTLSCNDPLYYDSWKQTTPEETDDWFYLGYDVSVSSSETLTLDFGFVDPNAPSNTAPTIQTDKTEYTVFAGVQQTFEMNFTDNASDTHVFKWDFGGGNIVTTKTATYTFTATGVYTVKYTVTDSGGESASADFKVTVENKVLTVNASANQTSIRIGNPIYFQGSVGDMASGVLTYLWDFGDGQTSNSRNVNYLYKSGGTYTAKLTVTDATGGVGTNTVTITVQNNTPIVNLGEDKTIRISQNVSLPVKVIDQDFGSKPSYTIDFGDGQTEKSSSFPIYNSSQRRWYWNGKLWASNTLSLYHNYTKAGTYTVKVTMTDSYGMVGSDEITLIVANDTPTVNLGEDKAIRISQNVSLPVKVIDQDFGSKPSYTIDFGDGQTEKSSSFPTYNSSQRRWYWNGKYWTNNTLYLYHNYTRDGIYKAKVTMTDSYGAVGSDEITVTVANDTPKVNITSSRDQSIRIGQTLSFTAQATDSDWGNKVTYLWDFGDGTTSSQTTSSSHTFTKPGIHKVKLSVTDGYGATGSSEVTVTVLNDTPAVNAGEDVSVELGKAVNLIGKVTDKDLGNSPTYVWTFSDGSTANGLTASQTFSQKGTFTATLTATDSYGASASDNLTINVTGALPIVTMAGEAVVAVDPGSTVDFSGSFTDADGGTHSYVWKFSDDDTTKVGNKVSIGSTLTTSRTFTRISPEGGFVVALEITDNEKAVGVGKVTVHVRGRDTDPCLAPTIRSQQNGSWVSKNTWSTGQVPTENDWILINHEVTIIDIPDDSPRGEKGVNESAIVAKGLCIEQNGILQNGMARLGFPTPVLEISAFTVHNKGTIQAVNGKDGIGPRGNRGSYKHAMEGGSIKFVRVGKLINESTGKILAGHGGDDLIFDSFPNWYGTNRASYLKGTSVNAIGGTGGNITGKPYTVINHGLVRAGHGGFGSTNSRQNPQWGSGRYSERNQRTGSSRYLIQFSDAHGGNGGLIDISALDVARGLKDSINTGKFVGGDGGDAVFFVTFCHGSSSCANPRLGKGGTTSVNVSKQFGLYRTGNNGRFSYWEPILLEASNTTRIEGGEEVVIFAGDNANMDLRGLVAGAITAEKTITIAVGKDGTVDLTGVSGEVFKAAEKVEIFADNLVLDEGTTLESLTNAANVEIGPSKIIYNVTLSSRSFIVGQPNETIPVKVEVTNGSPADDIFTISVSDSAGWSMDNLPEKVSINGLRYSELMLNVTLPDSHEAENVITITATSQSDSSVQTKTEIRMGVVAKELPTPPRGNEKAEIVLAIDNSMTMGNDITEISNAIAAILGQLGGNEEANKEMEAFLEQFENNDPPEAELQAFMTQLDAKYPQSDDPLAGFPMVELLTFTDEVVSQVVTKDVGNVIYKMRSLALSDSGDCSNASVAALEQALANVEPNGTIILATASAPHKDAAAMIAQAKQQGIKVNVMLAGSCGDEATDKALYQNIADSTGGTFKWLPDATSDENGIVGVITDVVTDGFEEFTSEEPPVEELTAVISILPESGEAPLTVTLDGSASTDTDGTIASYKWTASDGQTAEGENAQLTFNEAGDYTITLEVTDDKGATNSATGNITAIAKRIGKYTAYGTIRDELGNKLAGVTVQVAGQTVITNAAGYWEVSQLQEGKYTITVSKDGYTFAPENVEFSNNEADRLESVLKPLSQLKVKVVADPRVVKQDDNVTYIATIINGGNEIATGVVLTNVLAANAGGLISIEALDGGECDAATVTCTLPDLTTGNSARVKLVVSNTQASSLLNTATVTANEYPADVQNTRTRVIPHLAASITDSPDPLQLPLPGEKRMLHYDVAATLSANAPSAATGVNLVMTLPKSGELQAVNSDYGMCDISNLPTITCSMTDLSVESADSLSHVTVGIDVALKDAGLLTLTLEAKLSANEYPVHTDKERTSIFIDPKYKVGLVFVIDDTGSMQGEINQVKAALNKVIDAIDPIEAPLSVLLTFGDEVKYRAVTQDLTVLRDAIAKLKASGGGACPEASFEAISFAIPHLEEGGTILFATDASPYEGSDVDGMIARLKSNAITFDAMIFGDCADENSWNQ